jgi:hypothetical protein
MKKVYIDKATNTISQIIREDYDNFNEYNENTFGDLYYMIEAEDDEIENHGYTFNKRTLLFEKINDYIEEGFKEVKSTNDKIKELEDEIAELKSLLKSFVK